MFVFNVVPFITTMKWTQPLRVAGPSGAAPGRSALVAGAIQPSARAAAATCCRLSQPVKLIPFICVFSSVDTGCCAPLLRRTVSVASVSCARYSFHASFVSSQPQLINKTPPFLLAAFLRHLSAGAGVGCQTSRQRRFGEGLKGTYKPFAQEINRSDRSHTDWEMAHFSVVGQRLKCLYVGE